MHFGENQLSPRSVGISPLSTGHPPVLQHWWVRASTARHCSFTLPMDSSRGFGSVQRHLLLSQVALFRLGFPVAPLLYRRLTPATLNLSPDHSTKGTPSVLGG